MLQVQRGEKNIFVCLSVKFGDFISAVNKLLIRVYLNEIKNLFEKITYQKQKVFEK